LTLVSELPNQDVSAVFKMDLHHNYSDSL